MPKIRIGIVGYGNLGKGVELAISQNDDMVLSAVFTRRPPGQVRLCTTDVSAYHVDDAIKFKQKIDVMIMCGGSATDLPIQGPQFAQHFNVVDSFDTHAAIPQHFAKMDVVCKDSGKLALISSGWDPGLFSIHRALSESILPQGDTYTFWGKGVSQGHSDAIRRIKGVKEAVQYTVPLEEAVAQVKDGLRPKLTAMQRHIRDCYVVAFEDADKGRIEQEIKAMPNYFSGYQTIVTFIDEETFKRNHSDMPHGGFVIRSGNTGKHGERQQLMEFSIKLDSNPEFTASVLVAYARAVHRMHQDGLSGAKTVFDVAPAYLSRRTGDQLRAELL